MTELTQEIVRELLDYDPETGVLKWKVKKRGTKGVGSIAGTYNKSNGYWQISIDYKLYYAHRIAFLYMTGKWPTSMVDHINKDRLDNRWSNLREANHSQNGGNTKQNILNTTGYRGVTQDKRFGCYYAQLAGKNLGTFKDAESAAIAYDIAAIERFGVFAETNFNPSTLEPQS